MADQIEYQYEVENTIPCANLDKVIYRYEQLGWVIVSILQSRIGNTEHYSYDVAARKPVDLPKETPFTV